MQLLKGSDVHIVNGTVTGNAEANPPTKMVIQNYSNLTISNSTIEDGGTDTYVLSNNFGEVHLKDHTKIIAKNGHVAFDVWYGMAAAYDEGVTVYIDDPTVEIVGKIEYGKANRARVGDWLANAHLYVCKGYDLDSLTVVDPNGQYEYVWREAENGYYELKRTIDVAN